MTIARSFGVAVAAVLALAPVAHAWHIAGNVSCDENNNGQIDAADTPLVHVGVKITSQTATPGQMFTGNTDSGGAYNVGLPTTDDDYLVQLTGLHAGWTIVIPGGGSYTVHIDASQDHLDGVDFLVQGCGATPTTTTSTTTSTTRTTTTTTTTTTTLPVCPCPPLPFVTRTGGKVNNRATILASIGANDVGGQLRLSRDVTMPDGTEIFGDLVEVGNGGNVSRIIANTIKLGGSAVVRNGTGTPTLPLETPFCVIPSFTCGGPDVIVPAGTASGPLAPGSYGSVLVQGGGTLTLGPGTFRACALRVNRGATIENLDSATVDVTGLVVIGGQITPASGVPPVVLNVAGLRVRVDAGALVVAQVSAPNAQITFGRDAIFQGSFCADSIKTDKRITLECPCH